VKIILQRIASLLAVFVFAYLIGSFISASFDITTWLVGVRVLTALLGSYLAFVAFAASWLGDHA
jgi:hypothetical protein